MSNTGWDINKIHIYHRLDLLHVVYLNLLVTDMLIMLPHKRYPLLFENPHAQFPFPDYFFGSLEVLNSDEMCYPCLKIDYIPLDQLN